MDLKVKIFNSQREKYSMHYYRIKNKKNNIE